ncbi:MAG: hypothetical protein SW833_00890 [Cyanobacteriota bacterium]|nr:hypothetical protein [Cyanobacteriota bacterium]
MKRNWIGFITIVLITAIAIAFPFSRGIAQCPTAVQAQQLPSSPALPEVPTDIQDSPPSPSPTPAVSPSPSPEATESPSPSPPATPSPSPEATESPSPSPTATPTPSPEATESPSPSPPATPTPTPTPTPAETPTPTPTPTSEGVPSAEATESLPAALPLAETPYTDTAIGYQVGIIEGYEAISLAGVTSIASPDGNLAYTVTARPRAVDNPLNEASLAQVAIEAFARGEGFVVAEMFEPAFGGVKIPWTGSLTQGGDPQSLSGLILSRQVPGKILILLVAAATEEATKKVDTVFNTVAPTLEPIN